MRVGETVVIVKMASSAGPAYEVIDRYRLLPVGMILGFFFLLAILLGGIRGATSILGLVVTILVLAKFIVPRILAGQNPLAISLAGAFVIALLSIFLAHGLSRRTTIALVSTLLALAIGAFLSAFFVSLTRLFGVGTEEAFYLQLGPLEKLNLRGLLLGGIILGALGVLDDVTTAQAGAVDEISQANPNLRYAELYRRGLSVGREHITSLVNTLVLAYAGASLPLFLLFSLGLGQPLWVLLNSEFIVEEVVRTLVGSICLMLAVPITTTLAAYVFHRIRVVE
ncbi:MAG TPA: YibE/F family protein [bacterium]|nr:YibE/F family protein [bacterium]